MNEPDDFAITEAMILNGGGFVSQLGTLFRCGDPANQAKLKAAFPDYFATYTGLARMFAELRAAEEAKP